MSFTRLPKLKTQILILLSAFCFFSCKNSYENLIADFNSHLGTSAGDSKFINSVNSADFDESQMLKEYYIFYSDFTVCLKAPDDCASYEWTANSKKNPEIIVKLGEKKNLFYELPGIFFTGYENTLTLKVTDSFGTVYEDTAVLIINGRE